MSANIFYSWQSDLPNNTNRSFIEGCIEETIKQLNHIDTFLMELSIDKDTMKEPGTPDVAKTIFEKIEKAKVFIADVSIINSGYECRKTPNPNVLVELGFAAKVLGWERVVCMYDTDYGAFEDLPFNIRARRPLSYSLKGKNRATVKKAIVKALVATITELRNRGLLFDDLADYLKIQVDTQVLSIARHFIKLLYGYDHNMSFAESINHLFDLKEPNFLDLLKNKEFLGFLVFKKYEYYEKELKHILDKSIASPHYERTIISPVLDLMNWIGRYDKFTKARTTPDLFMRSGKAILTCRVESGKDFNPQNHIYPERYILLKPIGEDKYVVKDFGDFQEREKIEGLRRYYTVNAKYVETLGALIYQFIEIVNVWLDRTGGEFLMDTIKEFEIRGAGKCE